MMEVVHSHLSVVNGDFAFSRLYRQLTCALSIRLCL